MVSKSVATSSYPKDCRGSEMRKPTNWHDPVLQKQPGTRYRLTRSISSSNHCTASRSLLLRGKTKKEKFFSYHGLAYDTSALSELNPALDTVLSYPPDPAHSDYYGMIRRLYTIIGKHILTPRVFIESNTNFQRFSFPSGWG